MGISSMDCINGSHVVVDIIQPLLMSFYLNTIRDQ